MAKNPEIKYFPTSKTDREICPGFFYSNPISGCPHQCAYCFIQGTAYGRIKGRNTISVAFREKALAVLEKFAEMPEYRGKVLGWATETGDIFAIPEGVGLAKMAIGRLASNDSGRKVLLLSKSNRLAALVNRFPKYNVIVSYSVNPLIICQYTDSAYVSFTTIEQVYKMGYRDIRLRIDPIIPWTGWHNDYLPWLNEIPSFITRITLGTLRATDATYRAMPVRLSYLLRKYRKTDGELHPWRIAEESRAKIYDQIIPVIKGRGFSIGLCKEHRQFYKRYGIDTKNCNCLP